MKRTLALAALLAAAGPLLAASNVAEEWRVNLVRTGGTTQGTYTGATIQEAVANCRKALITTVSREYDCQTPRLHMTVTVTADPPPPPPAPVDCVVSAWSTPVVGEWSACANSVQTRTSSSTRTVVTPAANGGAACPSLTSSVIESRSCTVAPPPTPVAGALQYSDLDSVPVGGFVTVWGKGLGAGGRVTVGGTAAAVLSWTDTMIEFKVLAAGDGISVSRPDGTVIGALPFTARTTGRLLYADSVNGKNTCDGSSPVVVSATVCPFKDQGSNGSASNPNRMNAGFYAMKPGDVLYLRAGTYASATDTYGGKTWLFIDGERSGITAPNVGSQGLPIAVTVYPGETADVGSDTFGVGVMPYGDIHDITLAKFKLHSGGAAMSQNTSKNARIRLVGITTAGPMNDTYNAFGLVGTDDLKVLGLTIANVGKPGEKLSHAIYYEGYGTSTRVEIAYNRITNERGGRGIQVYAHQAVDHIDQLLIHDNVVDTTTLSGILVGQGDGGAPTNWITRAEITNNLVRRSGNPNGYTSNGYLPEQSALHVTLPGCDFVIRNNTFAGDNVYHTLWLERAKSAVVEKNLFESKSIVIGFSGGSWIDNAFVGLPKIGTGVTAAAVSYDSADHATGTLAGYGVQ
jgi:hypothetical protein